MKKIYLRLALLFTAFCILCVTLMTFSDSSPKPKKNTICLNMIVKNESAVIRKCLSSVKGLIDYWVIVDTGSTDGTQAIIKEFMRDIPGELHQRPWVDFGYNRNEALQLAKNKAEYSMILDADEVLAFMEGFKKPILDKDLYKVIVKEKDNRAPEYGKCFLVKNELDWQWKGVMHEYIESPRMKTSEIIQGVINESDTTQGARFKNPRKYLDDADMLKKGLEKEPNNSRYQFYLGQCYVSAKEFALALQAYEKRVEMGIGFDSEYFYSLYMIGRIQEILAMPPKICIESYQKAHAFRPSRLEPLFYMAVSYIKQGDDQSAYDILKKASLTPESGDDFFVDGTLGWKLYQALGEVSWRLGKPREALAACEKLITCKEVPLNLKEAVKADIMTIRQSLR